MYTHICVRRLVCKYVVQLISAIVYCGGPSSWSQNSQMLEQGLDITAPFWGPQPSTCGPWHLLPVVRILGSVHSVHSWTSKLSRFHTSAISETAQRCQEKTCCQPLSQRFHHFLFAPSCPRYRTASQDGMVSTLDPPWAWAVARRAQWQHRWLWTRPSRQPLVACAFSCSGVSEAIDGETKRDFLSSWTLLIDDYWCSLQFCSCFHIFDCFVKLLPFCPGHSSLESMMSVAFATVTWPAWPYWPIPSLLYHIGHLWGTGWCCLIPFVNQFQDCYTDVSQVCNLTIFGRFKGFCSKWCLTLMLHIFYACDAWTCFQMFVK